MRLKEPSQAAIFNPSRAFNYALAWPHLFPASTSSTNLLETGIFIQRSSRQRFSRSPSFQNSLGQSTVAQIWIYVICRRCYFLTPICRQVISRKQYLPCHKDFLIGNFCGEFCLCITHIYRILMRLIQFNIAIDSELIVAYMVSFICIRRYYSHIPPNTNASISFALHANIQYSLISYQYVHARLCDRILLVRNIPYSLSHQRCFAKLELRKRRTH